MTQLLFIGDIVGEPGLAFLEANLPDLLERHRPEFVIANAENLHLEDHANGPCGMTDAGLERLFRLGVQCVTGGNHSWDGPEGMSVHADSRVLRPLNRPGAWPGRGAGIVTQAGFRLGVVNLAGRSALSDVSDPGEALEHQLEAWGVGSSDTQVDAVLIDMHGESVYEKVTLAHRFSGRIAALVGTHTHAPTNDAQVLEGGVAYLSDVGMTGPSGGVQGYHPASFVAASRAQSRVPMRLAAGPVELGAALITLDGGRARSVARLPDPSLDPTCGRAAALSPS